MHITEGYKKGPAVIVSSLREITPFRLLLISIVLSELCTGVVVAAMSVLLHGRVRTDFMATGLVAAFLVSLFITRLLVLLTKQLRKSDRLFLNNILNSITDPLMVLDRDRNIILTNNAFTAHFADGHNSEVLKKTCHEVLRGSTSACEECLSNDVMLSGRLAKTTFCYHKDAAARKWYDIFAFPIAASGGRIIGSVHHMRDITARKKAEKKIVSYQQGLRSLAHQLLAAEERERRKIAQELHDGLSQKLVLSKMLLKTLQSGLPLDKTDNSLFSQIYALYGDMMNETKSLTFELAPPVLYEVGLEPAVVHLLDSMLAGIRIEWTFENRRKHPPLKGDLAPALYTMIRELVLNVIKHAEARQMDVTIGEDGDMISAIVEDDGKGMPSATARRKESGPGPAGFGLFSIRERLYHLGGRLMIDSQNGSGTRARIEIPLALKTAEQGRAHTTSAEARLGCAPERRE